MDVLVPLVIGLNAVLFGGLALTSLLLARRERSPHLRSLWFVLGMVAAAFVLGAIQRLGLQLHRSGRLSNENAEVLFAAQLIKSLVTMGFACLAVVLVRRIVARIRQAEHVVTVLTDQVAVIPTVSDLGLTPRELQVLEVIGSGALSDEQIAEAFCISAHTAHTHVRNILRKAGMHNRRDLMLLTQRDESIR